VPAMRLTVIGCGDAFGAGGRLQTAFHVSTGNRQFLIDCGASTLIGMRRLGLDPGELDMVCITHLHGDHFGGLPWFLIDGQFVTKRKRPLVVTGPQGTEKRFLTAAEALYPDSTKAGRAFDLRFLEYDGEEPIQMDGLAIRPFEVIHPSGAPPYALRFETDGKTITFTGDTGWTEKLCKAARGADLFISECFQYDVTLPIHLDYKTIDANYEKLNAKQVLLTHMGAAMLSKRDKIDRSRFLIAEDGMTLDL
jgi:ribonuclease BN (tRNA processing enzyme)